MTITVVLTRHAESEVQEAFEWYERAVPLLGERFLAELDVVLSRVAENPKIFPHAYGFRRAIVPTFPYCIYFRESEAKVVVVAVFHGRRNPKNLRSRRSP